MICICLKGTPPSLNRLVGHEDFYLYRNEKARWTKAVYYAAMRAKPRVYKPPNLAAVRITYYFGDAHRRDPDNYCGKLLLDGLTKAGLIVDDCFAHLQLQVCGKIDRENPRTMIEVSAAQPTD